MTIHPEETTPFEQFLAIVAFDQGTKVYEQELHKHKQGLEVLQQAYQKLVIERDQAKHQMHQLQKRVDELELIMKELDQKISAKRKKLDTVVNNKEYQSLLKEIGIAQEEQQKHEETLLQAWTDLERAQKNQQVLVTRQQETQAGLEKEQAVHEQAIVAVQQQLQQRNQERTVLEKTVPAEWLETYAMMRSRVNDPVAAVVGNVCSACSHTITSHEMAALQRKKVLQCQSCFRFLYIPAVMLRK